jgi:hypothetical protein
LIPRNGGGQNSHSNKKNVLELSHVNISDEDDDDNNLVNRNGIEDFEKFK